MSQKISDARFAKMSQRYEQERGEKVKRIKALRLELKSPRASGWTLTRSLQQSGTTPTPQRSPSTSPSITTVSVLSPPLTAGKFQLWRSQWRRERE